MNTDNVKINLNQNLWALLVTLSAVGAAEYYNLCTLYFFGLILSVLVSVSFAVTLTAYTINYWKMKMKDN